ncbi:MAG TPA: xylose isomerase, partial [Candidatus Brachybacterium merdigallinarum]|nr:xylose isomerase [Candidatus Brachybacterium merdigallinarum]
MTAPTPTRDDKFSFGLWTTGWEARDQFGLASRPPLQLSAHIRRLAELGAWGFTFHDNDVVPFDATPAEREQIVAELKSVTEETGLVIEMITTDTFAHPVFKDGAFTSNDRSVRRFGLRKVLANVDFAAE